MTLKKCSPHKGFTLAELLITIGIIGVLSAVVIFAVSPGKFLRSSEQAKRQHSAKQLMNAQYQYIIDKGSFAANKPIPEGSNNAIPICRSRVKETVCVNVDPLLFDYLPCLPLDGAETNNLLTGYKAYQQAGRFVSSTYSGSVRVPSTCEIPIFPRAQWKLDETSAAAPLADYTDNGFTATGSNFTLGFGPSAEVPPIVLPTTGSFEFDGTDDVIDTSFNELQTLDEFTLSAWFKADDADAHHIVWQGHTFNAFQLDPVYETGYLVHCNGWGSTNSQAHEMHLSTGWLGTPNRISFFYGEEVKPLASDPEFGLDPVDITAALPNPTGWHHVAVTLTNASGPTASAELFLDGVSVGKDTGTFVADRALWEVPLQIGKSCNSQRLMNGNIDDVRVYDKVLRLEQIKKLSAGLP